MEFEIDIQLQDTDKESLDFLTSYDAYKLYISNEDVTFILALNDKNIICGCFEFHEVDDQMQLAHMYVSKGHQRHGIGKAIIKEAVNLWRVFMLPSTNNNDNYYYIEYGFSFIQSCFTIGILKSPAFNQPQ